MNKNIFSRTASLVKNNLPENEYVQVLLLLLTLLASFLLFAVISTMLFGFQNVFRWSFHFNRWFDSTTKINHMQSVFSLGAATSAAFAFAGPQIQHALGPRVQEAIQHARLALRKPNSPSASLKLLIRKLYLYDRHKRDDAATRRSNLFPFHLTITLINVLFLVWTALIDPRGELQNKYALILIFVCIFAPLVDLRDVFFEARRIRPILQKAKDACDSGIPEQIDTAADAIEAEIKRYPSTE